MAAKKEGERDKMRRLLQCLQGYLEDKGLASHVRTSQDSRGIVDGELRIRSGDKSAKKTIIRLGEALDDCEELQNIFSLQKDPERGWKSSVIVSGSDTEFPDAYRPFRGKYQVQTHYGNNIGATIGGALWMIQHMRDGAIVPVDEVIYRLWSRAAVGWTPKKGDRPRPPKRRG